MRLLLQVGLISFFMASSSALAAENAIRVIREDGSVTEYNLPEGAAVAPAPLVKEEEKRPLLSPATQSQPVETRQEIQNPVISLEKEPPLKEEREAEESSSPQTESREFVPVPGRKPLFFEEVEKAGDDQADQAIAADKAISIAISYAPPAKDFKISRKIHNDIPVYVVVFDAEEGSYTVVVDARTGDVISAE